MTNYPVPKQFAYIDPIGKFQRLGTPIESTEHLQACIEKIPNTARYLSVYGWSGWSGGEITSEISKTANIDGIFFDFDDAGHPEKALMDAAEVAQYVGHCTCNFSGAKGAHVMLHCHPVDLIPDLKSSVIREFANMLCDRLPELSTMDFSVVGDTSRVRRIINSMHPSTGLYAVPLSAKELSLLSIDEIREMAEEKRNLIWVNEPSQWITDELYRIEGEILRDRLEKLHVANQIAERNYKYICSLLETTNTHRRDEIYDFIHFIENEWRKIRSKKYVDLRGEIIGSSAKETWLIHAVRRFKATGRAATGSRTSEHKARVHLAKLADECGWTFGEICNIYTGADDYDAGITEKMMRSCIRR